MLIFIIFFGIIFLGLLWLIKMGKSEYRRMADKLTDINALSMQVAEVEAFALLANSEIYRCVENFLPTTMLNEAFPLGVKRLFSRYEQIESVAQPGLLIKRDLFSNSDAPADVLVLGRGLCGADTEFDIGIYSGEEKIYEFHGTEKPDPVFGTCASIFHLLIKNSRANLV